MATTLFDPEWPPGRVLDAAAAVPCGAGVGGRRYWRLHESGPWGACLFVKDFGAGRAAWRAAAREFRAAAAARHGGAPVARAWAAWRHDGRAWLLSADSGVALDSASARSCWVALAQAAAALHAAGGRHGDMHVRNALRGDGGTLRWIDLRRWRRSRGARARAADLGHLLASLQPFTARELLSFCAAYLVRRDGQAAALAVKDWARAVLAAAGVRFRRHHGNLDRRARRAVRGLHPEFWRAPELAAQRAALERAVAGDAPRLKAGDRSTVARVEVGGTRLVVKHFRPTRRFDPRDACGRSKALINCGAAEGLARRGFPCARPLAAWSRAGAGSWLVLEDLAEAEPLHLAVTRVQGPVRAQLLRAVARCLRRLHAAGVSYRDLKPSNLLVRWEDGTPWLAFIDHDRNRFSVRETPPARARRDLAALHAGLPPEVRASERLRALLAYDPRWISRAWWRTHVRPLLAEAAARQHRWQPRRLLGGCG